MHRDATWRAMALWNLSDLVRLDGPASTFLDCIHDAVYIADERDRIVYWNRIAEDMTGYSSDEVVGREIGSNLFVRGSLNPDVPCEGNSGPQWLCSESARCETATTFAMHKQGHRLPVKLNASPIGDGNAHVIGLFVVFWGVSCEVVHGSTQESRVTELLQQYVSRETFEMAHQAARGEAHPECVQTEMTVMFVDIAHFTSFAEWSSPEGVRSLLNEFLAMCEESVLHHGGDIDKFIGDCVMAVFKCPDAAVAAGKKLLSDLKERNRLARNQEEYELHVRMGIHTGQVVRGDIGGHNRKDCTVVGDAVNTAARLERLGDIDSMLISHATYSRLADKRGLMFVGTTKVRGKSETLRLYVG